MQNARAAGCARLCCRLHQIKCARTAMCYRRSAPRLQSADLILKLQKRYSTDPNRRVNNFSKAYKGRGLDTICHFYDERSTFYGNQISNKRENTRRGQESFQKLIKDGILISSEEEVKTIPKINKRPTVY